MNSDVKLACGTCLDRSVVLLICELTSVAPLVLVGLPARGKTYIAHRLARYLRWLCMETKVFNVGNYRRKAFGAEQTHQFFDEKNKEALASRKQAALEALQDMKRWFSSGGQVGIYDATNSTKERRQLLLESCERDDIQVLFVESICEDEEIILNNIRQVKLSSPDYINMDPDHAVEDFRARIRHYEEAYETISEPELSYIKLINVGEKYVINRVRDYLQSRIIYYLMNLQVSNRSIFLTRVRFTVSFLRRSRG